MKKILALFASLLISTGASFAVIVPKNTVVEVGTQKFIQSKWIKENYEIKAKVKNEVIINGISVFQPGNTAILFVEEFEKAKGFGKGGKIVINGGYVSDDNGNTHLINVKDVFVGKNKNNLWKIIPFKKGEQAKILPSYTFETKIKNSFEYKRIIQKSIKQKNTTVQVGIGNKIENN